MTKKFGITEENKTVSELWVGGSQRILQGGSNWLKFSARDIQGKGPFSIRPQRYPVTWSI